MSWKYNSDDNEQLSWIYNGKLSWKYNSDLYNLSNITGDLKYMEIKQMRLHHILTFQDKFLTWIAKQNLNLLHPTQIQVPEPG